MRRHKDIISHPSQNINKLSEIIGVWKRLHVCDVTYVTSTLRFAPHKFWISENKPCRSHRCPADTDETTLGECC